MADYRIQITAQLSPWSAVDEARVRATTGAIVTAVAPDIARIELRGGVREPRRPAPSAGSAAAAVDPDAA